MRIKSNILINNIEVTSVNEKNSVIRGSDIIDCPFISELDWYRNQNSCIQAIKDRELIKEFIPSSVSYSYVARGQYEVGIMLKVSGVINVSPNYIQKILKIEEENSESQTRREFIEAEIKTIDNLLKQKQKELREEKGFNKWIHI